MSTEGATGRPPGNANVVLRGGCFDGAAATTFEFTEQGSLRHSASGKCVHPFGGSANPANDTELVLHSICDEPRLAFSLEPSAPPPPLRFECAGELYSGNVEGQRVCPSVCDAANGEFMGQWTNSSSHVDAAGCDGGSEAVCQCRG